MFGKEIKEQKRRNRIINKFKRSKFNYYSFVDNYYIDDDNKAYISVKCDDYYDVISKFSIKDYEWIDQEFADYVTEQAYFIPLPYDIVLEICGKFNETQQEKITRTIKSYFGVKLADAEIEIKRNKKRRVILLLSGIVTSLLIFLAYKLIDEFSLIFEPIFILFWFLLETYLDDAVIVNGDLKEEKLDAAQLANVEVIFNENEK